MPEHEPPYWVVTFEAKIDIQVPVKQHIDTDQAIKAAIASLRTALPVVPAPMRFRIDPESRTVKYETEGFREV